MISPAVRLLNPIPYQVHLTRVLLMLYISRFIKGIISYTLREQFWRLCQLTSRQRLQPLRSQPSVYLRDLSKTDPRLDKKRILETKGPLLRESYSWILDHRDYQQWLGAQNGTLWIKGDPGKGKTMLLCGIVESLEENGDAENDTAYFFCQATDARINNAAAILGGLTFSLARRKKSLLSYVRDRHPSPGKSLFDGPNGWVTICDIFEAVIQDSALSHLVLIVDALDECTTDRDSFLRLVVRTSSRVKWLLSSRNLEEIQRRLFSKDSVNPLSLELKENAEAVSRAVHSYINHCVAHMEIMQEDKDLESKVRDILQRKSNDTFLWVALAIRQIQDSDEWEVLRMLDQLPEGLPSLYHLMMDQIQSHPEHRRDLCIKLLSIVTTTYRHLHLGELITLWQVEAENPNNQKHVRRVIQRCGSFLTVKEDIIYFVHQSAKDFLLQQGSQAGIVSKHYFIFKSSLDTMFNSLHRDIYGLKSPGIRIHEVSTPCPDPLALIRYQCVFWIHHLLDVSEEDRIGVLENDSGLHTFFTKVFLFWLEALSLLRSMDYALTAMYKFKDLINSHVTSRHQKLVEDVIRFIQYNRGTIESLPLQTYSSALAFAPEGSIIRQEFINNVCDGISLVLNRPNTWGTCVQTLFGHRDQIMSLAFSPASHLLFTSSLDETARIWEMETGNCQQILLFGSYHGLAKISPDSKKVASSDSTKIYIWNTDTGEKMHTLHGDGRKFWSIAFAFNSKFLASAYQDMNIWIWCTETGNLLHKLQRDGKECNNLWIHVAFSPDLRYVVAAGESAATVWNIEAAIEICNLPRQGEGSILAVVFSPNSKLLASAHWYHYQYLSGPNACINVWCISTGSKLKSCRTRAHPLFLEKLAFSSNTELIVPTTKGLRYWRFQSSPNFDNAISATNTEGLSNVDFSFDMAFFAGSDRMSNTISVWQLDSSGNSASDLDKYGTYIHDAARVFISPDSSVVASSSSDKTVTLWRTDTGKRCQTFTGHTHEVTAMTFSHDSSIIVTGDEKRTIRLWRIATGECITVLSMMEFTSADDANHWRQFLNQIAISVDLGIIACGSRYEIFILKKNNEEGYKCIAQYPAPMIEERTREFEYIAVSADSAFVTWKDWKYSGEFSLEHWHIDAKSSVKLHVGHQYRSMSYEE
ncbi:WD40-repeat-containing domain protein [Trichoderma evansii]